MISSYYLWKWADNYLPGKPNEVFATLLRGELHPALQTFNARPLMRRLEAFAKSRRELDEEWNWQVQPSDNPAEARFVFLTGPNLNDSKDRGTNFEKAIKGLWISGYDEQCGHVIHSLKPKLNCFVYGQDHRERHYDITAEEVPVLLRRIDRKASNPYAILEDRRHYFVQCLARNRRFCAEWRENYDPNNWDNFKHWRAYDMERCRARRKMPLPRRGQPDHYTVTFADTVRIFQAFIQGDPKPPRYYWHDIRTRLEREEARRKKGRSGTR